MDQPTFEEQILEAVRAKPKSGAKWHPFEELFAEEHRLRASGALNNSQGDTRTRADQLFKAKTHRGFETEGRPIHSVFVLGKEAADLDRDSEDGLEGEIDESELENIESDSFLVDSVEKIALARPVFARGEGTRSVLIFRCDEKDDEDTENDEKGRTRPEARPAAAPGELIEGSAAETAESPTSDENPATGASSSDPSQERSTDDNLTLTPRVLLIWEEDDVTELYREWYPELPVIRLGRGRSVNIVITSGDLGAPSDDLECPLIGLDKPFRIAAAALRAGKHVVLYGPPGTGKTDLAEYLCRRLIDEPPNHFDFTTATSDWTTFDVIGGYLPDPTYNSSEAGSVLDFVPGVVTRALETGRWLIIDELNRADIDKAFGELFTLLSDKPVKLAYKKRIEAEDADTGDGDEDDDKAVPQFADIVLGEGGEDDYEVMVPGEWRMLGTMNTFDKASLFRLSFAFMRRFAFVEIPVPEDDDFGEIVAQSVASELDDQPDDVSDAVRDKITSLFVNDLGSADGVPDIGPAVAIDIVKYCDGRLSGLDSEDGEMSEERITETVLEGAETHLYPQLEGRDRAHGDILEVIAESFGLEDARRAETSRRLGVWTGFEAGIS